MELNDRYFLNPAHVELARARYFLKDENGEPVEKDIDEVFNRVVNHIYKDDPEHKEEALELRREKKIIDAGRPLAQAGTEMSNLYNCFVCAFGSDDNPDPDTREAISELKRKHFNIQAQGGGVGINFSSLRPAGSVCKTNQSRSSGAVGFITDFSYQSSNISQGGNRCLPGDTRVAMADGTWKNIIDIRPNDIVLAYDHSVGKPVPSKVVKFYENGIQDIDVYKMHSGITVRCTNNHRWVTSTTISDKDYVVRSIQSAPKSGSKIGFAKHVDVFGNQSSKWTKILGYLLGDGCFTGETIKLSNTSEDIINRFKAMLPRSCNTWLCSNDIFFSSNGEFQEFLRDTGLYQCRSYEKFIPDFVFRSVRQDIIEFINGLIATDGWINETEVGFCSTSKRLVEDLRLLLLKFGIHGYHKTDNRNRLNREGKKYRTLWSLYIKHPDSYNKFLDIFDVPSKMQRMVKKSSIAHRRRDDIYFHGIKEKSISDHKDLTFCIEIEHPDHLFITEYGISHNSGANLGVLNDWHPDLYDFVTHKTRSNWENIRRFATVYDEDGFSYFQWQRQHEWQMFNVSVLLSDEFMARVINKDKSPWILKWKETEWPLWKFKNTVGPKTGSGYEYEMVVTAPNEDLARYKAKSSIPFFNGSGLELVKGPYHMSAPEWFDLICKSAHEDGCPGILFMDMAKRYHNGEYFNPLSAANPCFSGDSLVAVADGRGAVSIKELAEEGKDIPVYSMNSSGEVEIKMGRNPRKTRENSKMLRVTLDDGTHIDVTDDHNFILLGGTRKKAHELKKGDSLPRFIKRSGQVTKKNKKEYLSVNNNVFDTRRVTFEHRLIAKFNDPNTWDKKYIGSKQSGWIKGGIVVHHKDYNPLNNRPENLEIMTFGDHSKFHGKVDNNGKNNPMFGRKHTEESKRKIGLKTINRNKDPEYKKRFVEAIKDSITEERRNINRKLQQQRNIENWKRIEKETDLNTTWVDNRLHVVLKCSHCKSEMVVPWIDRSKVFCSSSCHLEHQREFNMKLLEAAREKVEDKRNNNFYKQIDIYNNLKVSLNRAPCKKEWEQECKKNNVPFRLRSDINKNNVIRNFKHLKELANDRNHRVVSVTTIPNQDVYNITVDDNHTVGIITKFDKKSMRASGIFSPQCAEELLPANGVCCLTSVILPSFFQDGEFMWDEFARAIYQAVRGLDNVISVSKTGEKDIDDNAFNERRIGLGTTGGAELLIMAGLKYSSQEGRDFIAQIMEFFRDKAYEASIELAKERGAFPAYEYKGFSQSEFFKTLPEKIQNLIRRYGIRNVTVLCQAPSGTTGTMLGYSTGCEPYFAMSFLRNSRVGSFLDGSPSFMMWLHDNGIDYADYNYSLAELRKKIKVPDYFEEAHEISWEDHLKMQAVFSKYVDASVSKCVAKGTLINTDHGILPIESISSGFVEADSFNVPNKEYTVLDENGEVQKITAHYFGGHKPCLKIRFSNGFEITSTYTHKYKTERGFVRADDISVGDKVFYRTNGRDNTNDYVLIDKVDFSNNINRSFPSYMSEDYALFIGMWLADGFSNKNSIGIVEKSTDVERVVVPLMRKLFGDCKTSIDSRNGVRTHLIHSRSMVKYFKKHYGTNAANKVVPSEILQSPKSVQIEFLRGLTLDGFVKRNGLVIYEGYSRDIVNKTSHILSNLGIRYYIGEKNVNGGRLSNRSYSVSAVNAKDIIKPIEEHKRAFSGDSIKNYQIFIKKHVQEEIIKSFAHSREGCWKRRNATVSFEKDSFISRSFIDRCDFDNLDIDYDLSCVTVTKIEDAGVQEVYDIEVENTHSYLINGIVTHNTINLPNAANIEDVKKAYVSAYKMGIKSTTVYRDGSKQQILETIKKEKQNQNPRPQDIVRAHAPKRPAELPCDIHHTSVKGDKWTVLVGLLDGRPYEVFCASQDNFEIAPKYKSGTLVKNGGGSYYLDTGDFKLKNISSYLNTDEHRVITRLISTCLRHGVPMPFIADQLAKADGTVVDFSKAVLRVLKKYGDLSTFTGQKEVCSTCGSTNVVINSGCPECLDCGTSKCG